MAKAVATASTTGPGKTRAAGKSRPKHAGDKMRSGPRAGAGARRPGWSLGLAHGGAPAGLARLMLPSTAVILLHENSGISLGRIGQVAHLAETSLAAGRSNGPLPTDQADRLMRLSIVCESAVSLFEGRIEDAREWLDTPLPVLEGKRPLDLAETDGGMTRVTDLVCRIEHGIVS